MVYSKSLDLLHTVITFILYILIGVCVCVFVWMSHKGLLLTDAAMVNIYFLLLSTHAHTLMLIL